MKTLTTLASAAVLATSIAAAAAPAHADVVLFASFNTGNSNALDIDWVRNGSSGNLFTTATPTATTLGATAVKFTFFEDPALPDFEDLNALFTLSADVNSVPVQSDGSTYTQTSLDDGSFKFVYNGPTTVLDGMSLVQGVSVLLSGAFNNARLVGSGGVGDLTVSLAHNGDSTFASSFYDFSGLAADSGEFTFHLGRVTPVFKATDPSTGCFNDLCTHVGTTDLNNFRAHIGGDLQAYQLSVPEPATWGLMIMGFGGAGAVLRRRRASAVAA